MQSDNPNSGIYETEQTRTLDLNGGDPRCNQGGTLVCEKQTRWIVLRLMPLECERLQGYTDGWTVLPKIETMTEADYDLFLRAYLLDKRLIAVLGNCDRGETGEAERLLELDGVRILLTHGHGYSVKSSLLPLRRRALELDVQLVLYGHTHLPALSEEEGVLFCNPGSCMGDRLYAEIELQDGKVADARLCQAEHRITRRMKPTWWKS